MRLPGQKAEDCLPTGAFVGHYSRRHVLLSLGAALTLWPLRTRGLVPGALAVVTFGPSRGTVVRLERTLWVPPGCDACAVRSLQPSGPVWVVDRFLLWDVDRQGAGALTPRRRYRLKLAPWTGLRPL
jgi:hypothetical protein